MTRLTNQQVIENRNAKRLQERNVSELSETKMQAYESQFRKNIDPVAEILDFNAVDFIAKNKGHRITPDEIQKVHMHCIRDGRCHLCQKGCYDDPGDMHLRSSAHLEKVHEQALCNRLFSESKQFRRLSSEGCRCKSKGSMREYWGSEAENLGHLAKRLVYEENRVIFDKHGRSSSAKTYTITKEQNPKFHVAALRYDRETGKDVRQKVPIEGC